MVSASGRSPQRRVAPPGPAEKVWVSSTTSSVPVASHAARTPSKNPGSGRTIPMLVSAGSVSTQATSRAPSAASSAARSLNSTATDVVAGSTAGPALPGRESVRPPWATTIVSSTVPW